MSANIYSELLIAQKYLFEPMGMTSTDVIIEKESQEYGACQFKLQDHIVKFRTAKITPSKVGQFVTFWKRNKVGTIIPYDVQDQFDILIVNARHGNRFGYFIFPKHILLEHKILSKNEQDRKRALRVYPSWDIPKSPQAIKTQAWQLLYFFEINPNLVDSNQIKALLINNLY